MKLLRDNYYSTFVWDLLQFRGNVRKLEASCEASSPCNKKHPQSCRTRRRAIHFLLIVLVATVTTTSLSVSLLLNDTEHDEGSVVASLLAPWSASSSANSDATAAIANYDAFYTPAVECRLKLEPLQNAEIDRWMSQPSYDDNGDYRMTSTRHYPLLEYLWVKHDEVTGKPYYLGMFNVLRDHGHSSRRAKFIRFNLKWFWHDQHGKQHVIRDMWQSGTTWARIYFRIDPPKDSLVPSKLKASLRKDVTKKTAAMIYDVEPFVQCSKTEQEHPPPTFLQPNKPKIGACVSRFWDQHDLMPEWIAYHRLLGIDHFFLFVAEPFDKIRNGTTMPRFEKDITYIPYNYRWKDHQHNVGNASEISFGEDVEPGFSGSLFQVPANIQCLQMAKQYGLDWVITHDVDEYIVIRDPAIQHFTSPSPLQQYFEKNLPVHPQAASTTEEQEPIGEVCLFGAAFGRHPVLEKNDTFQLNMDFTYRRDRALGNGEESDAGSAVGGRRKCFYNVSAVNDVWIHNMVVGPKDKPSRSIKALADEMEVYHFRTPLTEHDHDTPEELAQLKSYTELRDQYRQRIATTLQEKQWTFPNFTQHTDAGYAGLLVDKISAQKLWAVIANASTVKRTDNGLSKHFSSFKMAELPRVTGQSGASGSRTNSRSSSQERRRRRRR